MKKLTILLLALLLVLSATLIGCTPQEKPVTSEGQETESTGDGTENDGAEDEADETTEPAEPVELSFAIITGMQEYYDIADAYMEQNPNVTITIEEYPSQEFRTLLKAKLQAGEGYDIFPMMLGEMDLYAESGHCADLSDMTDTISRYRAGALTARTYDGVLISLPAQLQSLPVFYNKAIFKENGLSIPTNWDEFISLCDALKAKGITPFGLGLKDGWPQMCIYTSITSNTVQSDVSDWGVKKSAGEVSFVDTPSYVESVVKFKQLIDNGYFAEGVASTSDEQATQMFANSECAMYAQGTWALGTILGMIPEGFEFGAFPLPANDPGEALSIMGSVTGDFSVWAESENIVEAKKFLAFTLSQEQNAFFNANKGPSPLADVEIELHPSLVEFYELAGDAKLTDWLNNDQKWPTGLSGVIQKLTQELFIPEQAKTPEELLKAMDDEWAMAES